MHHLFDNEADTFIKIDHIVGVDEIWTEDVAWETEGRGTVRDYSIIANQQKREKGKGREGREGGGGIYIKVKRNSIKNYLKRRKVIIMRFPL